jgi:hypothetical protein
MLYIGKPGKYQVHSFAVLPLGRGSHDSDLSGADGLLS